MSRVVPIGQIQPQKYLPKGIVRASTKTAHRKSPIHVRAETMADRPIKGSVLRIRSTGILIFKGYVADRKRKKKNTKKRI
jgi:hypothetical protein